MKMVGERPLNAIMDGLADMRRAKVKEAYEKATVKCKSGTTAPVKTAPPAAATAAAKKAPSAKLPIADDNDTPPKKTAAKPPTKPVVCLVTSISSGNLTSYHYSAGEKASRGSEYSPPAYQEACPGCRIKTIQRRHVCSTGFSRHFQVQAYT